jgi:predicted nucleic acid-binding protein
MPVVDTSFLIDLDRGEDAALAALHVLVEDHEEVLVPPQTAIEYLTGYEDAVANLSDLEASYEVLDVDRATMLETAQIAREAIEADDFPGWPDACIAAAASLEAEEVLTANPEDFEAFGCETWDYRNEVRSPGSASD